MIRPDRPRLRVIWRSEFLRATTTNVSARVLAIVGVALATVVVARVGGPAAVGYYALLRMLPGLVGVLAVAGLPASLAYFLAGSRRDEPGLWPTMFTILGLGAALGTLVWLVATPVLGRYLFSADSMLVVAYAGSTVGTQLLLTVGKTALQGLEDRRGGDAVIAAEELAFLPCYAIPLLLGLHGTPAIIVGLAAADLLVAVDAWRRVARRLGWVRLGLARAPSGWWGRPDLSLLRRICSYGMRGQVGGLMTLLNLRLDFAILGVMAGPAVLGTYAVASKFAELLKLPGTAITWVSYPRLASVTPKAAALKARALLWPTLTLVMLTAVPALLFAGVVLRGLYGSEFDPATGPARALIYGMFFCGASGVASGYLYGRGRPGLNSVGMGLGLVLTVVLDVLLIPRYEAMGAAVASSVSYIATDLLLISLLLWISHRDLAETPAPVAASAIRVPTP